MRGMMSTIALLSYNLGILIVLGCGLVFPWRKVALICALFPLSCLFAVLFVTTRMNLTKKKLTKNGASDHMNINHYCRFPNHHHGYCWKIGPKMLKNHFNGYVDGLHRKPFTMNFRNYKTTATHQTHVWHVQSNRLNATIRGQHFGIKSKSSNGSEHWNRWFWSFVCTLCWNFASLPCGNRILFKCSRHSEHRLMQTWQPL